MDLAILQWIQDNLRYGVLDTIMPAVTALGAAAFCGWRWRPSCFCGPKRAAPAGCCWGRWRWRLSAATCC